MGDPIICIFRCIIWFLYAYALLISELSPCGFNYGSYTGLHIVGKCVAQELW